MAEEKADRDDPRTSERKYVPFPITPPNAEVDEVSGDISADKSKDQPTQPGHRTRRY